MEELPMQDGQPCIDENNLQDYSDDILKKVSSEIEKSLKSTSNVFNYPGPFVDVEGIANWRKGIDDETEYLKNIKQEVDKELFWRKQKRD